MLDPLTLVGVKGIATMPHALAHQAMQMGCTLQVLDPSHQHVHWSW